MAIIISITNQKGGVGKTTTTLNLGSAVAEKGKKVLLVDLDGQAASSRWLGVEDDDRLTEALLGGKNLQPVENVIPGVSLAPASGKLDSVSHELRPTQGGQPVPSCRPCWVFRGRNDLLTMIIPPTLNFRSGPSTADMRQKPGSRFETRRCLDANRR